MHKKWLKVVILAGIVIPIAIFIVQVDFVTVFQELHKIGAKFMLILLVTFVAYLLGTIGWWVCLGEQRNRVSLWQLFGIRQVGETVGLYNPSSVIGGDLLKSEMLKSYRIADDRAVSSVVVSRVTAVLSQLLLAVLSLSWLLATVGMAMDGAWYYGIIGVVILLVITQVLFFYLLGKKQLVSTPKAVRSGLWQRLRRIIVSFVKQAQGVYQDKRGQFWLSYFFFLLHWLVGGMEFYLILLFLGYPVQPMQGVLLDMGVIVVKSLGAFVPGQIGVEELANKLVLASIGIHTVAAWVTVSILRRARQLIWIMIGTVCYICIRKTDAINLFKHGNPIRQS